MASKQQLTQVDYSAMVTLSDPALGFVALGAKSDGLYVKLPGQLEEKLFSLSYIPEDVANKVTSISGISTNIQYPSAKLVYDQLALKQNLASNLTSLSNLTYVSTSFVKMTGIDTFTLDTNIYLTAESDTLNSVTNRGAITTNSLTLGNITLPTGYKMTGTTQNFIDIGRMGFINQLETTIGFDGVDLFTLGSVGASWSYYRLGVKYTITGSKTITVASPMVDNTFYFIFIDSINGTLSVSTTPWTLLDSKLPVATLFWNSTLTPKYILSEERHSILIDRRTHYYDHYLEGTRMQTVGALAEYTLNSDLNASKTFSIGSSTLVDEDIIQSLSPLTKPDGINTDYVVGYRTSPTTWNWKKSNMPFVYNVGNSNNWIQYDNNGTMTDLTGGNGSNTRWVNSYLLCTNSGAEFRYIIVPGRAVFTTLASAQTEDPSVFNFPNFFSAEYSIAYRITWSTITSTSQGKCVLAANPTKVTVAAINTASNGIGIFHNSLAGLDGGIAGEQYHLTAEQHALITKLQKTAYDTDIVGVKNGINLLFTLAEDYVLGSLKVYLNGMRLHPGITYDYIETSASEITFNYPPVSTDTIIIDYIKL